MANSLIELYGGGMTGKSNNYQLGGRVASARRRRDYQGEMRELSRKQEEANRRKKKSGFLGTLGSIAGGTAGFLLGGPGGAAIGAGLGRGAGESSYAREDFGGGKYAQDTRGELSRGEDDYRSSIGEKMAVDALSAYLMPGMYESLGKGAQSLGTGVKKFASDPKGFTKAMFGKAQLPELAIPELAIPELSTADSVLPFSPSSVTTPPIDLSFGDAFQQAAGQGGVGSTFDWRGNPYLVDYAGRGGGLIDMTMPQYENGGMIDETKGGMKAENERRRQSGLPTGTYGDTQMQQTKQAQQQSIQASPYTSGYGTATDVRGVLGQLGMSDIYYDPRFDEFADDLPQFGMGYAQQVGDIYSGGRQTARGIRGAQRQAAGQRGFNKSGIGQQETQQAFGDLRTDVARQRRGVVEGFQSDFLSAIGDIEAKGEFEFGTEAGMGQGYIDNRIAEAKRLQASQDPNDQQQGNRMIQDLEGQGYNISFLTNR